MRRPKVSLTPSGEPNYRVEAQMTALATLRLLERRKCKVCDIECTGADLGVFIYLRVDMRIIRSCKYLAFRLYIEGFESIQIIH